jgi:hypothetical protein
VPRTIVKAIGAAVVLALMSSLEACAPDAVRSSAASGFNGYLDSLKTACPNLRIGPNDIGRWLRSSSGDNDYQYWLDMTSKLYYGRISPDAYRSAVGAQLGSGSSNSASFDCIIRNLPAQRDSAPPPRI